MPQHYIDTLDDQLLYERIESFLGGVDGFTRSTLLPPDVSQYFENVYVRDNGDAWTRPGADILGTARGGVARALLYYDTPTYEQLICCANGKFTHWDGATWSAMEPSAGSYSVDTSIVPAMAQGVDLVLISDGTNAMRTWNGANISAALSTGATDPPAGASILCYHAGRMWAAGFSGAVAGKENDALYYSDVLDFGNGKWDSTTKNFRVGQGEGSQITALASLQKFVLVVGKANSIWLIRTDPSATDVTAFAADLAPEGLTYGVGIVGPKACCVYGNDLLFVSPDKTIRSLARMQAAVTQYELSAPLSIPIQPWIDRINWDYSSRIVAVKYRELALFSVPLDTSTTNNAILVWNGRLGKWMGVWTGWPASSFEIARFGSTHRLVIGDTAGRVRQWKDAEDKSNDATYTDDGAGYATKLWTRSMLFSEPVNPKDLYHFELRFSNPDATTDVTLMCDNAAQRTWTMSQQNKLTLPFTLPATLPQNVIARRGLRGQKPCVEVYLKIESATGWWALRSVTLSAYLNSLINQD